MSRVVRRGRAGGAGRPRRRARPRAVVVAAAVTVVGLGGLVQQGLTASLSLPTPVLQRVGTTVSGGVSLGRTDTLSGTTITAVVVQLQGPLTLNTVTARFGSGSAVNCTKGSFDVLANRTPVTCGTFSQNSQASVVLTVTVA